MQAILDFLAAIVVALTAAAFAQFGVTLQPKDQPRPAPEARRTETARVTASDPGVVTVQDPAQRSQGVDSRGADVDKSVHRGA